IGQVDKVLEDIGAGDIPQVLVFNKIDRLEGAEVRHEPAVEGRERVWLSARDNLGLEMLEEVLVQRLSLVRIQGPLHLPAAHSERLRSRLHALGAVRAETHDEDGWHLQVDLSLADAQRLAVQAGGAPLEALLPEAVREEWMA
ncbi:MAG: GTPase HflX, partial [Pseudoxanthomonas sp.]